MSRSGLFCALLIATFSSVGIPAGAQTSNPTTVVPKSSNSVIGKAQNKGVLVIDKKALKYYRGRSSPFTVYFSIDAPKYLNLRKGVIIHADADGENFPYEIHGRIEHISIQNRNLRFDLSRENEKRP